jgi:hypothetical protein
MAQLTGKDLLSKISEFAEDTPKDVLARETGYTSTKKDGTERVLYSAFYEALLEAKGLALAPAQSNRPGRELSFLARVQASGNLIIGKAYTAAQEFVPGDEFSIEELEEGGFKLLPLEPEAEAVAA